jgi:hypothetical protein
MKINEEKKWYITYEVKEFCCKRLKKNWMSCGIIGMQNGMTYIGDIDRHFVNIDYCPFCGEKIRSDDNVCEDKLLQPK